MYDYLFIDTFEKQIHGGVRYTVHGENGNQSI